MFALLPPDKLKQVHIAFDQAKTIKGVCTLMDVSPETVKHWLLNHPELKSYLKNVPVMDEADVMSRPALPTVVRPTSTPEASQQKTLAAIEAEKRKLKQGFESIGITGAAADEAAAFNNFGKHHFEEIRNFMSGGICKTYSDILQEVKDLRGRLKRGGMELEEEQMVRESLSVMLKLALEHYDRANDAVKIAAMVKAAKEKAKKPGFSSVMIRAEGNVSVAEKK